jgi:hypothetical protein
MFSFFSLFGCVCVYVCVSVSFTVIFILCLIYLIIILSNVKNLQTYCLPMPLSMNKNINPVAKRHFKYKTNYFL